MYSEYIASRADFVELVVSLNGKVLICGCDRAHLCHGYTLIDMLKRLLHRTPDSASLGVAPVSGLTNSLNCEDDFVKTAARAGICDLQPHDIPDDMEFDEDDEFGDIEKFKDFAKINESERVLVELNRYKERPSW